MTITQRIQQLFARADAWKKDPMTNETAVKDSQGRLCPITMFSDVQLARNLLVTEGIAEAKRRATEQNNYHQDLMASITEFFRISAEEHKAKGLGTEDGVSMVSIDGLQRIKVVKAKSATANEKLMIAKTMLEKLVEERGANIEPFFKTLALSAFETSSTGQMRLDKVMELKNLRCDYPEWLEIKAALDQAIEYVFKKRYVVFYERESVKKSWVQIPLNLHNN
jgi:hypothetical protein